MRAAPLVIFSQVRRSNLQGSLLVVVFLGLLGRSAMQSGRVLDRISGGVILTAAFYVAYQVLKRVWGAGAPHTLRQLEQRRDDLRRIWSWFLGPVTGALVAFAVRLPLGRPDQAVLWLRIAPFLTLAIIWSLLVWRLARREARRLQDEIDALRSP
jgi:hypothetical protein